MLLELKAHTLKVEKVLKKKQVDDILDMPEFRVCAPFPRRATVSNRCYSRILYKTGFLLP